MPLLQREPDCYPGELLDEETSPSLEERDRRWWLIYTRSRREKDLMRRLFANRVPFYGPVYRRRLRGPSGRVRDSFVPLFPGYVFLFGNEEERRHALTTNCVSTILPIEDQTRLVGELGQISRLIASEVAIAPEERLEAGQRVRVVSGLLAGLKGVVIDRRGHRRLLVAIDLLQQGASADLDECDLQPL